MISFPGQWTSQSHIDPSFMCGVALLGRSNKLNGFVILANARGSMQFY